MRAAWLIAAATALYVLAAWAVKPGFYDGAPTPGYDYVSPPPYLAPGNIQPTSGSGTVGAAGGVVTTKDQPINQAGVRVPAGALPGPATIRIQPYAPPRPGGTTLEGNAYCVTADHPLNSGSSVQVTLLVPANEPFPSAMYRSPSLGGSWVPIGGTVDLTTYLMTATSSDLGCFAVGYATPKQGGPGIRGQLLPLLTAALIVIVVLAGLPLAIRRRLTRRQN